MHQEIISTYYSILQEKVEPKGPITISEMKQLMTDSSFDGIETSDQMQVAFWLALVAYFGADKAVVVLEQMIACGALSEKTKQTLKQDPKRYYQLSEVSTHEVNNIKQGLEEMISSPPFSNTDQIKDFLELINTSFPNYQHRYKAKLDFHALRSGNEINCTTAHLLFALWLEKNGYCYVICHIDSLTIEHSAILVFEKEKQSSVEEYLSILNAVRLNPSMKRLLNGLSGLQLYHHYQKKLQIARPEDLHIDLMNMNQHYSVEPVIAHSLASIELVVGTVMKK